MRRNQSYPPLFFLFALLAFNGLRAQSGELDPTFGGIGSVAWATSTKSNAYAVAVDAAGRIVSAGEKFDGPNTLAHLERHLPDGTPDASFGDGGSVDIHPTGQLLLSVRAVVIQPDGRIVAISPFIEPGPLNGLLTMRLLPDGQLDPSFSFDGLAMFSIPDYAIHPTAMLIRPDGHLLIAGYTVPLPRSQYSDGLLVCYRPDGTLDTDFGGGDGHITFDLAGEEAYYALALADDGKILAGGSTDSDLLVNRFFPDGTPDASFSFDGAAVTSVASSAAEVRVVTPHPDGRVTIYGHYGISGLVSVRYTSSGQLDQTYQDNGMLTESLEVYTRIHTGLQLIDGRHLLTGDFLDSDFRDHLPMVCIDPDGELCGWFGEEGLALDTMILPRPDAHAIALAPDGSVVVAGEVMDMELDDTYGFVARYLDPLETGIRPSVDVDRLRIAPNPAQDRLHIDHHSAFGNATPIEVFDVIGRSVRTTLVSRTYDRSTLDVRDLVPGIYHLRVGEESPARTATFQITR